MEFRDEVRKFFDLLLSMLNKTKCLEFVLSLIIHVLFLFRITSAVSVVIVNCPQSFLRTNQCCVELTD